jgi:hypothetical protein
VANLSPVAGPWQSNIFDIMNEGGKCPPYLKIEKPELFRLRLMLTLELLEEYQARVFERSSLEAL